MGCLKLSYSENRPTLFVSANNFGVDEKERGRWLDYGARMYMSDIGRWGAIDPAAELYFEFSPYHFVRNSPTNLFDINGMYDQALINKWRDEDLAENGFDMNAVNGLTNTRNNNTQNSSENSPDNNSQNSSENSPAPPVHNKFTRRQFIKLWEQDHGIKMTNQQKRHLKRGCIGITTIELSSNGRPVNPPLTNAVSTFSKAQVMAKNLEDDIKNNPQKYPPGTRSVVFSKRFWSSDASKFLPDSNGKVNMTGYDYSANPGFVNFDYGLYDSRSNTWWHANHCAQCGMGKMSVYQSDLDYFSRPLLDFNRQVFIVTTTTIPAPN
jgi:RHS repeat-associated protein